MTEQPARLFVVDDEEDLELLIRQRFRRSIRLWGDRLRLCPQGKMPKTGWPTTLTSARSSPISACP